METSRTLSTYVRLVGSALAGTATPCPRCGALGVAIHHGTHWTISGCRVWWEQGQRWAPHRIALSEPTTQSRNQAREDAIRGRETQRRYERADLIRAVALAALEREPTREDMERDFWLSEGLAHQVQADREEERFGVPGYAEVGR